MPDGLSELYSFIRLLGMISTFEKPAFVWEQIQIDSKDLSSLVLQFLIHLANYDFIEIYLYRAIKSTV